MNLPARERHVAVTAAACDLLRSSSNIINIKIFNTIYAGRASATKRPLPNVFFKTLINYYCYYLGIMYYYNLCTLRNNTMCARGVSSIICVCVCEMCIHKYL